MEATAIMAITVIDNAEVYAPEPLGPRRVLIIGGRIAAVQAPPSARDASARSVAALRDAGLEVDVIDARGCVLVPGLIDPHAHLIGAGGEEGFVSRQPEIDWAELVRAGVTTVVGCLGTDAVGRSLESLLAKARELEARGLTTFIYTGSFQVPPPTITGSVVRDLVLIDKVIGVGEVAIADVRSSQPTVQELARIVADAYVGGTIAGKAGVTHFHTGPSPRRLAVLHELLGGDFDIEPRQVYPTHVSRTREVMDDAIALARRGA